ncbi:SDR family oxidoreductase [Bordetella genomosp. 4]|uniref:Short-chain dehydrogenase n=1 Tax=Bordetella genomosp. 4 TaxID=463044 RepID=A0A261U358_9BORD|nr:SDR family oxidoreductase [Bordetella genomosp. 4]OZI49550.1 short-chain dehydrogenase [Bordetella genomosp. 4]OZI55991.1 short-chain dehydrogenase [Bordetella genomosp. 4]
MTNHSRDQDADATARRQRELQRDQDQRDAKSSKSSKSSSPVQAGERDQPEPPQPAQHQQKPGRESDLDPAPRYSAPEYRGSEKLDGKVALITGADSGIGRAVAVLYAREGADVAVAYLNEDDDAAETKKAVEAEGSRCITISGDVRDPEFCQQAVNETVSAFGQLDILVNNAAFQEHAESLEDISDERLDETLRTNIYGYFYMARAALPHLPEGGCIINTGSVTGLRGSPQLLDYSATKGAIHSFTRALAANLVSRGIRVNAVAPGPVWTPLNPADRAAEDVRKFGEQTQMGRAAQPEELSPAYVFLAAPCCSSYITGIVLPITGNAGD